MERKPLRPMTPFDHMVTPPYLYTLKLLLPYTPSSNQHFLAAYIKFLELQNTLRSFRGFKKAANTADMFEELRPYMAQEEAEWMEQMEMMMQMMEMFQNSEGFGAGDDDFGGFNPMDMMMGMFGSPQKGEDEHE